MTPNQEVPLSRYQNPMENQINEAQEITSASKNTLFQKAKNIFARAGLVTSLVVSSLAIPGALLDESAEASTVACGTVLVSSHDWLGGQGVDVHSNGWAQATGDSCAGDNEVYNLSAIPSQYGYGWQCVELANRLYAAKGWYPKLWLGSDTNYGAKYLYTYAANGKYEGLEAKANGSGYIPAPGDMIIHSSGAWGHVAIVDRIDGTTLYAVEQNNKDSGGNPTGRTSYSFNPQNGAISKGSATISGYIHAEKNTYSVGGNNKNNKPVPGDFNGDKVTDATIYRPSDGMWHIRGVGDFQWGGWSGDIPVPADYNGDGKNDIAIYRPQNGGWYIRGVGDFPYGWNGDIPVPGDYDGDGKADIAVYRPSDGMWHIRGVGDFQWGGWSGDIPVPGYYNNDNKLDIAIYRPQNGGWYIRGVGDFPYGWNGDVPVQGDYNGDGVTDMAVYRPQEGGWHLRGVGDFPYGWSTDIPAVQTLNAMMLKKFGLIINY